MKFKRKSRNRTDNNEPENKAEPIEEKDWFAEQYEKLIGKPLPRRELSTEEVIKKLQDATKYRWIPEAKAYKGSVPAIGPVHYFQWSEPEVKKCTCLDSACTCKGDLMFPRKKIPRGKIYFKSPFLQKIMMKFTKSAKTPSSKPNFTQRLTDLIEIENEFYKDLEQRGDLNLRGAEFCFSRCIRFYGPARLQNSSNNSIEQKARVEELKLPEIKAENGDVSDQKHDGFAYTVSTPSTVVPSPDFDNGKLSQSQEVFELPGKVILKDISGTRLHISSIQCSDYDPNNLLLDGNDKLFNFGERLNIKELKNKFRLLKQNIYSSIIEMKDNKPTLQAMSTQYDDIIPSNKSSAGITIATPYKGVTVIVKKKPTNGKHLNNSQLQNKNSPFDLPEKLHSTEIIKIDRDITNEVSIKDMITNSLLTGEVETKIPAATTLQNFEKPKLEQKIEFIDSIIHPIKANESVNNVKLVEANTCNSICISKTEVKVKDDQNNGSYTQINSSNENKKKIREEIEKLAVSLNKTIHKSFEIKVNETNDKGVASHSKKNLKTKYYGFSLDQLQSSKINRFIKFLRNEKLQSCTDQKRRKENESNERITKTKINSDIKIGNKKSLKDLNLGESDFKTKLMSSVDIKNSFDHLKIVTSQNLPHTSSTLNESTVVKQAKEDINDLQINSTCCQPTHTVISSSDKNKDISSEENIVSDNKNKSKESIKSKIINFEVGLDSKSNNNTFVNMIRSKETSSELHYQYKENLCVNKNNNSESQKQESLTKIVLKLSSLLKRVPQKKNIKSLSEPPQHSYKSDQIHMNMGGAKKNHFQQHNEEPKSSEKEIFSIQYSCSAEGEIKS